MKKRTSSAAARAELYDWQSFDTERKAEIAYIKAERAGVKKDNRLLGHSLKVEEYSYSFGTTRTIYSLIRLKGRWLAKMFPPNSRVVIEEGEGYMTLRKEF